MLHEKKWATGNNILLETTPQSKASTLNISYRSKYMDETKIWNKRIKCANIGEGNLGN